MNQIIIDNRHKIDTACQLCFYALDKYHKAVEAFQKEKSRIAALPYVQSEQERLVNQAAESLAKTVQAHYEEIKHNLEDIRTAAGAMENLLDVGQDLQNALSVVKALGSAMPEDTRHELVEQFKGQYKALIILKAAYLAASISAAYYFDGLLFKSADVLDELDDMAYRIAVQPGGNMLAAITFGRKLEKFAVSMGVDLTRKYWDIVDDSSAIDAQIRAAAGLGAAD